MLLLEASVEQTHHTQRLSLAMIISKACTQPASELVYCQQVLRNVFFT